MAKKMKPVKKAAKKPVKKLAAKPVKKAGTKTAGAKTAAVKKSVKKPVTKSEAKKMASLSAKKAPVKIAKKTPAWDRLLTPLDDRLVIQIDEAETMTAGGLYIPDTASESGNNKGTVLAIGRGHKNKKGQVRPMDVKPGDRVLFDQYAGSKMILADTDIRILRESEVLGIVE